MMTWARKRSNDLGNIDEIGLRNSIETTFILIYASILTHFNLIMSLMILICDLVSANFDDHQNPR